MYQIGHDEGRIVEGEYEYNIKDHLGNLRVAFRDSLGIAKITQSNAYGCWGEDLPTLSYLKSSWKADNFKFTGKESLQGTGFIDFGARWYDNIVPRFTTIDPLSEISRRFSPFVYANNNPLRFIDPDGMASTGADGLTNDQFVQNGGDDEKNKQSRQENKDEEDGKTKKSKSDYKVGTRLIGTVDKEENGMSEALATGWGIALVEPTPAGEVIMGVVTIGAVLYYSKSFEKIKNALDPSGFNYVTYTKTNAKGDVYVGRSSGYDNPTNIVKQRDSNHHMKGFGPAILSTFAPATIPGGYATRVIDPAYWAIRGSEQLQIESHRRAGNSANSINGISPNNDNILKYLEWGTKFNF